MTREPGLTRYHGRNGYGIFHRIAQGYLRMLATRLIGCSRKRWLKVLLMCVSAVGLASCVKTAEIEIEVSHASGTGLMLSIRNDTPHHVMFEEPRPGAKSECFWWGLYRGQEIVASSGDRVIERPNVDPFIPAHTIPPVKEVWPGAPLKIKLSDYYAELAKKGLLIKGDTFLWCCRVWDETTKSWIQASGIVALNSEEP